MPYAHRDYSIGGGSVGLAVYDDRLEVTSTGSLHFGLTPEKLFEQHESKPWNPLIARTFYRRGLIEEWGRGTLKMAELAISAGLPLPEIEDVGDCVTVRFHLGGFKPTLRNGFHVTRRQRAILTLLYQEDGLSLGEIHSQLPLDTTVRQVRRALTGLRERGLAASTGRGRAARWKLLRE